jgi:putative ABC transport system permease protein
MMWRFRRFLAKLINFVRHQSAERELSREVDAHLGLMEESFRQRGLTDAEARLEARRAFGGVDQAKESHRDERSLLWLEQARWDVRYALRMLVKSPGYSLIAILTLALGIGANTAIFSVLSGVLLRPLAYPNPHQLVRIWTVFQNSDLRRGGSALPDYRFWRSENRSFAEMGAYHFMTYNLSGVDRPERLSATRMTASMWSILKPQPSIGTLFSEESEQWGQHRVVILSDGLWRRRFGGDPSVVGRDVQLNGQPYRVVGIMPASFVFPGPLTELWTPISYAPGDVMDTRNNHFVDILGRLKPSVTLAQAQEDLRNITTGLQHELSENANIGVTAAGLHETVVADVRPMLLLLMGAVGTMLLIACTNVANLSLARAMVRQKELTVRVALGASRSRLVRQLLTESLLLSVVGACVGLIFAYVLVQALPTLAPAGVPRLRDVALDRTVLAFASALAILTGLCFGLFPAWHVAQTDVSDGLKEAARNISGGRAGRRLRGLLVVTEVALSLVLVIGAGLLILSLIRLQRVDPGFRPDHLLASRIDLSPVRYGEPARIASFVRQLMEQTAALPGVVSSGLTTSMPLGGSSWGKFITVEGRPEPPTLAEVPFINYSQITPGYFRAIAATLRRGRAFTDQDTSRQPPVAIVDETAARRFWPNEDPLGKRISLFPPASLLKDLPRDWPGYIKLKVVGIVGDLRQNGLEVQDALPQVFVPIAQSQNQINGQNAGTSFFLVVRTATDPLAYREPIEKTIYGLDRNQPAANWRTMESLLSDSLARRRFAMQLLSGFALVALVLATIGLYGVVSYTANQRRHELGIRAALGGSKGVLVWLVLKQGLWLSAAGVGFGLPLAASLSGLISSQLFEVRALDPMLYGGASLLLLITAIMASGIPALRAIRVDPAVTLHHQ